MENQRKDVTAFLESISEGNHDAKAELFSMVYSELHKLAKIAMRREPPGRTLQTTALVHEAFIQLVPDDNIRLQNRKHFFGVAARAMRQILVQEARKRNAIKRGRGKKAVPLGNVCEPGSDSNAADVLLENSEDLETLDKALDELAGQEESKRLCTIVELRFFVGLTLDQTAQSLEISRATVKRDWDFAKAWLQRRMTGS